MEKLSIFFDHAAGDKKITGMHLLIFSALWSRWQQKKFPEGFYISRREILLLCKVSISTYHKCISDLVAWGYLRYEPSYHPGKRSLVYVHDLPLRVR